MPTFRKPRSQKRSAARSRRFRRTASKRSSSSYKKKKAYSPANKRRFIRRSNPVAENKQVEGSQLASQFGNNTDGTPVLYDLSVAPAGKSGHTMNTAHYVFIPDSPCYQKQGLDDFNCIGTSVYQRLCAAKFLIKWPQQSMPTGVTMSGSATGPLMGAIPDVPQSYKLYWGYVPIKHMLTGQTDPPAYEASAHYLEQQVNQRILDYFNERTDRIKFIPKKTATINIIGSKTLNAPNYNFGRMATSSLVEDGGIAGSDILDGNIADTLVKITWPINKKVHFEKTTKFAWNSASGEPATPSNGAVAMFRNYDHIPFAVIVSWNHDKLPIDDTSITEPSSAAEWRQRYARTMRCPQVLINDITYYRDS